MHTRVKGEKVKKIFVEQVTSVMKKHEYYFDKDKSTFIYEDHEWKNECTLRFMAWENDQVFLRTEYFVTNKKVVQLYQDAIGEVDSMPICGVLDAGWAYKYLDIPAVDRPWFLMEVAKLHVLIQKWIVEFECVGLSFFKELNDCEKVGKVLDVFNVSAWTPLTMWTGKRILHGICFYYVNTHDKQGTSDLFDLYRGIVKKMIYPPIKEPFMRLEQYIKRLPE